MEKGKKRYFIYLAFLLLQAVLTKPQRIQALLAACRINRNRRLRSIDNQAGEMLSFGVLEPCSHLKDRLQGCG